MSRIAQCFADLAHTHRSALIMYLTIGFPDLNAATELVPAIIEAGADMIELGVPFSDPLADGATVQHATQIALANGVNVAYCLQTVRDLRAAGVTVPLIFMGYYNPLLSYGIERFCTDAADAGLDGLIIPDLPPEESLDLHDASQAHGIDIIFMLAPTSTQERLEEVADLASGFIYCVSLTGTTGARTELPADLPKFLQRVRATTKIPLAVGFGISEPRHAQQVAAVADGIAVGSALLNVVEKSVAQGTDAVRSFVSGLRQGADAGSRN